MIRRATLADLPSIEDMLLRMKGRTEFRTTKVDFDRARLAARQCVSNAGRGFAIVAVHADRITGALFAAVDRWWFSPERFASNLFFHSTRGDGRAMLAMFKEWADSKGAQIFDAVSSSSRHGARIRGYYAEIGCVPVGEIFIGEKPIRVPMMMRSSA